MTESGRQIGVCAGFEPESQGFIDRQEKQQKNVLSPEYQERMQGNWIKSSKRSKLRLVGSR